MLSTSPALLVAMLGSAPAPPQDAARLEIDPRLVAQAAEVWAVIAVPENPVWPGWDASDTPLLLYLPGVQDVLINHPSPPPGFLPYGGPLEFPGGEILVRGGETIFELDGQNTSADVGGVQTLVVADTLSNHRQFVEAILTRAAEAGRFDSPSLAQLDADPYDQLGMIAHEAFHVFQHAWGQGKLVSEALLLSYPLLSVPNEVGVALEATALEDALRAEGEAERYDAALRWLAVRLDRRAALPPEAVAYEDGTEFNEGLAKYVEWRLSEALEGRAPGPGMEWVRGFRGYDDLSFVRDELLRDMRGFLTGERVVNDDPYGTAPVRFRLYYSGMAIAALLDRLLPEWKTLIAEPGATLTGLVEELLAPRAEDLARGLAGARERGEYDGLVARKKALREEGRRRIEERLQAILAGTGTLFTLDYSALGAPPAGWGYTPFGITVVDGERTIYSMVPVSVRLSDGSVLRQRAVAPLLHDAAKARVQFRLEGEVGLEELLAGLGLEALPEEPLEGLSLELAGVEVRLARGRVSWGEGGVVLVAE